MRITSHCSGLGFDTSITAHGAGESRETTTEERIKES